MLAQLCRGRLLAFMCGLAAVLALIVASAAQAGTYPMHQCASGSDAVSSGWSTFGFNTDAMSTLHNTCGSGGMIGVYAFSNGQAGAVTENGSNGSEVGLALNVPGTAPDVSIASLRADVTASSVSGDDAFLGFSSAGQGLGGSAQLPYGGAADYTASENWVLPQGARDFETYVNCSTDRSSPTCYFADPFSLPAVSQVTVNLIDAVSPVLSGVSGALASAAASGSAVAGSEPLSFTARDADSGVLSATLTLTPKPGGSTYAHTFDFSGQCAYDAWNACPLSQSIGAFSLDTSALKDGSYALGLTITDAAANVVQEDLGALSSNNAPVNTSGSGISVSGSAAVGQPLSAQLGAWSAANGAGSINYAYQWESCDGSGTSCQAIAAAQGASYVPTAADLGHTLRASVTAADDDGSSVASSAPSATVVAAADPLGGLAGSELMTGVDHAGIANGVGASETARVQLAGHGTISRSFAQRALTISGRLLDGQGRAITGASLDVLEQVIGTTTWQRIGQATSQGDGSFRARVPAGSSRRIQVAYRALTGQQGYVAHATIQEQVRAGVSLTISPRRTGSAGTIRLSGQVQGPISVRGVLVELLVHYLGQWQPFRTPRTDSRGRFAVSYRFQGGVGRFPFRVQVPAGQAGFPFSRGISKAVAVRTG